MSKVVEMVFLYDKGGITSTVEQAIYYAGPLTAGGVDPFLNKEIITFLKKRAEVLTEHLAFVEFQNKGEFASDKLIHDRDIELIEIADIVIAEISSPSLGVGYEIAKALEMNKEVICLYKRQGKRVSPVITGNGKVEVIEYGNFDELFSQLDWRLFCEN